MTFHQLKSLSFGLLIVFALPLAASPGGPHKPEGKKPMAFDSLEQAASILSRFVRTDDFDGLRAACLKPGENTNFLHVAEQLKYIDQQTPLSARCAGQSFPKTGDSFTIGSHAGPWNHMNIEFVKKGNKWFLNKIWICR
jgi:hypothetical protein